MGHTKWYFADSEELIGYLRNRGINCDLPEEREVGYVRIKDAMTGIRSDRFSHPIAAIESEDFYSRMYIRSTTYSLDISAPGRLKTKAHQPHTSDCRLDADGWLYFNSSSAITPDRYSEEVFQILAKTQGSRWDTRLKALSTNRKMCLEYDEQVRIQILICARHGFDAH